ncbi:glycosyltransferase family 2 protein [Oceanisphaera ostreae]|uniref:Glycosyltransferase family 2 protein n=1 Tax=Oceanisphaera ostreae TaxID=914151 RepID=A0ABW3KEA4_9GAMM
MGSSRASISIIIPAYNVEKYLEAALTSIKEQDELPDEVILIDDGSTDRTKEIAEAYYFPIPYQVVSIKNGGQGNARNVGVNLASSEYVYFFDSDDILTINFIKSIKEQICVNQHQDIILFSGESFNDNGYQGNRWMDYSRGFSGVFNNRTEFLDAGFRSKGLFCSPCLYVTKKSFWGPKGLAFGPNFLEDEALFYSLLFACRTFVVVDEVFFLRRNREGSTMTMTPNAKHVNGALSCMQTTLQLYEMNGLTSKERWHISKRLENHCIAYLLMTRAADSKCSYSHILNAIKITCSLSLLFKACIYASRLDSFQAVRKVGRRIKKLKECCAGR